MYSLDTNVAIDALRRPVSPLRDRLIDAQERGLLVLSSLVVFELVFGVAKGGSPHGKERLTRFLNGVCGIVDFDVRDAEAAGELRHHLESRGTRIGHYDTLVAAQAARRGLIMVTANNREFERTPGLVCENWRA